MKRIGILTSGGDAPGMNAAIRAVVRVAIHNGLKVSGIRRGYQGLIEGDVIELDSRAVGDIIQKGGTMLLTSRSEHFRTEKGLEDAIEVLKTHEIEALVVIGGNGTFTGAKKLAEKGFPTIGIPGTIDNDLGYTDNTIGFNTAINTVLDAIAKIRDTSSSHGRCNIIEVMGRHCGDIALYSGLAGGAEVIIMPEFNLDIQGIAQKLHEDKEKGKLHSIIVLAEGVGHPYELGSKLERYSGVEVRISVIGHLQRGGSPTSTDRILASKFGERAVTLLLEGKSSRVVGTKGNDIIDLDITEALKIDKEIDSELFELARVLSL